MNFHKTTLSNGLRVLSESHQESRCAVVGVWVPFGTRHESKDIVGVSHLVEHMVFKGTKDLNAYDLARSLESVGGEVNAYTGREYTCYHTLSLSENLDLSIHVLSQLVRHAVFSDKEFEKEKRVVQQEILMAADDLEEYTYDLFFENVFKGSSLGWPILGTLDSIRSMSRDSAFQYYKKNYRPENMIISAAGHVDHEQLVHLVEAQLGGDWGEQPKPPQKNISQLTEHQGTVVESTVSQQTGSRQAMNKLEAPKVLPIKSRFNKICEQCHLIMSFESASYPDSDRFEAYVLNTLLGGGMTSRLYQKVREDRGLAYSIFSLLNTFTDCGVQTVYAGAEPENMNEVIDIVLREFNTLRVERPSSEDLEMYKTQAKAQILISSEDIESRMNSIAVNEMIFKEYRSVDSVITELDKVSMDSFQSYCERRLAPEKYGFFLLGPEDFKLRA